MSSLIIEIKANTEHGVEWDRIRERSIWDNETPEQCVADIVMCHVNTGIKITVYKEGQFWFLETPGGTVTRIWHLHEEMEDLPTCPGWKYINERWIRVPEVQLPVAVPAGWEVAG